MSDLKLKSFHEHYSQLTIDELREPKTAEHWIALGIKVDAKQRKWHSLICDEVPITIEALNKANEFHWAKYPNQGDIVELPLLLLGEQCECTKDDNGTIVKLTCEEHAIVDHSINSQDVNDWIHTFINKRGYSFSERFFRLHNGTILRTYNIEVADEIHSSIS